MRNQLTSRDRRSSSQLLARILDARDLAAQVQALPWPILAKLVDHVGLEDAAPLVAFATTEQLARIFDGDLWRSNRPGEDERFDADRFGLWLAVMLEAGESFVAEKLSALPEDLVTLAFHRHMLVLNVDAMTAQLDGEDEGIAVEKALSNCLGEDWEHYHLVSRRHDGWDDIFAAVVALDREHHDLLMRVLERCCRMTAEYVDEHGGWYDVLSRAETLEADVAGEREERRTAAGYVTPSTAAAFLRLARDADATPMSHRDPLTQGYFGRGRNLEAAANVGSVVEDPLPLPESPDLLALLRENGVVESGDAPLLLTAAGWEESGAGQSLFIGAMRRLADEDMQRVFERSEEIVYLANVLTAGCSFRGRRMRAVEAVSAVMATCSLGLEIAARDDPGEDVVEAAVEALRRQHADRLFRVAWARLTVEVTGPAAETAERWLRDAAASCTDIEAKWLLQAARRVHAAATARTPWKALAELEVMLNKVEAPLVDCLRGLIDECPSICGSLYGSAAPKGATEGDVPRFISTMSELAEIHQFLTTYRGRR